MIEQRIVKDFDYLFVLLWAVLQVVLAFFFLKPESHQFLAAGMALISGILTLAVMKVIFTRMKRMDELQSIMVFKALASALFFGLSWVFFMAAYHMAMNMAPYENTVSLLFVLPPLAVGFAAGMIHLQERKLRQDMD